MLNNRIDLHFERLRESVSWGRDGVDQLLAQLMARHGDLAPDEARVAALNDIAGMVRREATVMAFADVFLVLTALFLLMLLAIPLVKSPRAGGGGGH